MAEDLADRLDDLICSFDKVIPGNFEGTVIFILAFWALAGAIVYFISVFVSKSVKEENDKIRNGNAVVENPSKEVSESMVKPTPQESLLNGVQVLEKEPFGSADKVKPEESFNESHLKEKELSQSTVPTKESIVEAKAPIAPFYPVVKPHKSKDSKIFQDNMPVEVIEEMIIPSKAYLCGGSKKSEGSAINGVIPYSTVKDDPFVGEVIEEIIIPSFAYRCGDNSSPPPLEVTESKTKPPPEKPQAVPQTAPLCSGSDTKAVQWVNSCFESLFEPFTMEYMKQIWIDDLNDYIKSLDDKICILVTDIQLPQDTEKRHIFTNIVSQTHQKDNITVTSDISTSLGLQLSVQSPDKDEVDLYKFNVTRLRGRLNISILNSERIVIFKLDGWPEIKTEAIGRTSDDEKSFVTEVVVSALRGTTITLDMDDFLEGTIFPIFTREKNIQTDENPPNSLFASGDAFFLKSRSQDQHSSSFEGKKSRSLSVLVVKASGLLSTSHPFVILELDEPSQKFKTGLSPSLMWNEDFTLHLSPQSKEILFEVWDIVEGEELFLGLGIVAVDELLIAPSQRHVIPLQGRPYASRQEESSGNGLLTIQFILSDLNKDIALNRSFEQAASGAIATLDHSLPIPVIEPMTILKNSPKEGLSIQYEDSEDSEMSTALRDESPMTRSRNRKKRRLVSTLKKRITGRSYSMGAGIGDAGRDSSSARSKKDAMDLSRSISADRAYSLSKLNTLEGPSNLPYTNAISTSTFISEESSLVMEVDENNIKKYYFIPSEVATKERLKRIKGTKLHVYMDHIFVAKHIKRGKTCEVCSKAIPFRLRKQGYICRDCQLVCHKPCHIQVATHCIESSLPAMDILHIKKDL